MQIGELSRKTGVHIETIRYYERIGLLPKPQRASNGYRIYDATDVERLRFVQRARQLDFALDDIREILDYRERGIPPCNYVMQVVADQLREIERRIADLQRLRRELAQLQEAGEALPEDVQMRECVCHLIREGLPEN